MADGGGDFLFELISSIPLLRRASDSSILRIAQAVSIGTFTISALLFLNYGNRGSLLERPTQSCVFGFVISGFQIIVIRFVLGFIMKKMGPKTQSIPLSAFSNEEHGKARERSSSTSSGIVPALQSRYTFLVSTAVAIALRVLCFEQIFRNYQCTVSGIEATLPALVALWECGYLPVLKPAVVDLSAADGRGLFQMVIPAAVVSWASILATRLSATPTSTTICPAIPWTVAWIVSMQLVGVLLDVWILHSLKMFVTNSRIQNHRGLKNVPLLLGLTLVTSGILAMLSGLLTTINPQYRGMLSYISNTYLLSVLWCASLFTIVVLAFIRMLSFGAASDTVMITAVLETFIQVRSGLGNIDMAVSPNLYLPTIPPLLLSFLGSLLYFYASRSTTESGTASRKRPLRIVLYVLFVVIIGVVLIRSVFGTQSAPHFAQHPIDSLISQAREQHHNWEQQASTSRTLSEAVKEYIRRYDRHPPPGFDKWYEYATKRSSAVIDDYDTIEENLRPFWKLEPTYLRTRTKSLLSDTANDCAEVSIRSGNASIGRVIPTHRWMVDGIIKMMDGFVTALPDMDIAFNINDEPRVTIPYDNRQIIKSVTVKEKASELDSDWSSNRAASWDSAATDTTSPVKFDMRFARETFRDFGSVACPANSSARQLDIWDPSTLCTSCFAPHSSGQFLKDWTRAADPCHQPDLAHLHGFYRSPSAFKATHEPVPIFSQSRAGGFADILYPSAWNYNDKVKYDPSTEYPDEPFQKKANVLFWRGTATEGFSKAGTWKVQVRQRLVHLAQKSQLVMPILLPSSYSTAATKYYTYQMLSGPEVQKHQSLQSSNFSASFGFVDKYPRCDNGDCEIQEANFGLVPPTDFQYHWHHRFLMDADGAGFSGRFLPFLQSHSVPVKTAIFREWYDSRLVAWKHFIPIDIRLHGLWSTISYFASGGFGYTRGKDPAETIAEDGRNWANKVLRKKDMEIYFYRLLLEYGRVTDDKRDKLGFKA